MLILFVDAIVSTGYEIAKLNQLVFHLVSFNSKSIDSGQLLQAFQHGRESRVELCTSEGGNLKNSKSIYARKVS